MKDALLLDFDLGAHRAANRRDTLQIATWADVAELMESRDALAPYSSLVVDTVGRCLDVITADIAATDPKKAPGGNLSQQGWGVLKNRFRTWVSQVRALGKDMLLISHDKEDKDGDTRIVRPDITGGSYGEVMKNADFVGYLYMSGKDRCSTSTRPTAGSGRTRPAGRRSRCRRSARRPSSWRTCTPRAGTRSAPSARRARRCARRSTTGARTSRRSPRRRNARPPIEPINGAVGHRVAAGEEDPDGPGEGARLHVRHEEEEVRRAGQPVGA
jgi:hypothetical protein